MTKALRKHLTYVLRNIEIRLAKGLDDLRTQTILKARATKLRSLLQ